MSPFYFLMLLRNPGNFRLRKNSSAVTRTITSNTSRPLRRKWKSPPGPGEMLRGRQPRAVHQACAGKAGRKPVKQQNLMPEEYGRYIQYRHFWNNQNSKSLHFQYYLNVPVNTYPTPSTYPLGHLRLWTLPKFSSFLLLINPRVTMT